ncbi:hypothetical protein CBS101457_001948 [Exobasidium rhododendri]|nr:hypothetical protein CBS101457_001948 [Exobasidium rhododendri]
MGRIDLASDGSTHSPRVSISGSPKDTHSPSPRQSLIRKGSHVRAKVDPSSFSGLSSASQTSLPSPSVESATSSPASHNPYLSRDYRTTSAASSVLHLNSTSANSNVAMQHSHTRNSFSIAKSSVGGPSPNVRPVRSPSPIRQLSRNPASTPDIRSSSFTSGDPVRVSRDRVPSGQRQDITSSSNTLSHARAKSIISSSTQAGDNAFTRSHVRTPSSASSVMSINGPARVASIPNTLLSSTTIIRSRSRSPSPILQRFQSGDRKSSLSSASSSTVGSLNRQVGSPTLANSQRSPKLNSRPPLLTNWSSYNSNGSVLELVSPTVGPSTSLASTNVKLSPLRDQPSMGEASGSNVTMQSLLLSPSLEGDAGAQEAKKNRKVLDLEITNRSLMAINSGLEVVKLKQMREIRELKRRLREGRALGSRMGVGLKDGQMRDDYNLEEETEEESSEEDDDDEEAEGSLDQELESAHARCKALIDGMVNQARESIVYKPEVDRKASGGGNRVLHPIEVEMMQDEAADAEKDDDDEVIDHFKMQGREEDSESNTRSEEFNIDALGIT